MIFYIIHKLKLTLLQLDNDKDSLLFLVFVFWVLDKLEKQVMEKKSLIKIVISKGHYAAYRDLFDIWWK